MLGMSRPEAAVDEVLDGMLQTVSQNIKDQNIQELSTQWFAQKANLQDFYNSAYSVLSDSVHVNVRHLENALNIDSEGELIGLNYGPSDKGVVRNVLTAAEALIISLRAAYSIIQIETAEEIHQHHDEFNILHTKYKEID